MTTKKAVQVKLKYAVDTGKIIKPKTCSRCRKGGIIHGHHPDYNKPLDVIWLYLWCHINEHVAQRLKQIRGARSQEEIARLCGVSKVAWKQWEKGKRTITSEQVALIAAATGSTPNWIRVGRGEPPREYSEKKATPSIDKIDLYNYRESVGGVGK